VAEVLVEILLRPRVASTMVNPVVGPRYVA